MRYVKLKRLYTLFYARKIVKYLKQKYVEYEFLQYPMLDSTVECGIEFEEDFENDWIQKYFESLLDL